MKKDNHYISCTDKRIVIAFIVFLVIAITTTVLLHSNDFLRSLPDRFQLAFCILITLLFFACWITTIALATILAFGFIGNYFLNRKSSKSK